jgi:hypothetical protein
LSTGPPPPQPQLLLLLLLLLMSFMTTTNDDDDENGLCGCCFDRLGCRSTSAAILLWAGHGHMQNTGDLVWAQYDQQDQKRANFAQKATWTPKQMTPYFGAEGKRQRLEHCSGC